MRTKGGLDKEEERRGIVKCRGVDGPPSPVHGVYVVAKTRTVVVGVGHMVIPKRTLRTGLNLRTGVDEDGGTRFGGTRDRT